MAELSCGVKGWICVTIVQSIALDIELEIYKIITDFNASSWLQTEYYTLLSKSHLFLYILCQSQDGKDSSFR